MLLEMEEKFVKLQENPKTRFHQAMAVDTDGPASTAMPAASAISWSLPRAKNCSPALNFYTSVRTGAALLTPVFYSKNNTSTPQWGACVIWVQMPINTICVHLLQNADSCHALYYKSLIAPNNYFLSNIIAFIIELF